jgi:hypothetical protein
MSGARAMTGYLVHMLEKHDFRTGPFDANAHLNNFVCDACKAVAIREMAEGRTSQQVSAMAPRIVASLNEDKREALRLWSAHMSEPSAPSREIH